MKNLIAICLIVFATINLSIAKNIKVENPIPVLDTIIGFFNFNQLKVEPFNSWFESEYEYYSTDTSTLNLLSEALLSNITITVVIGTWCSDSQRETPRFVKILDYLNINDDRVTAIGVNRKKIAPGTPVEELKIEYVPTFIFFRDDVEIGRIIESPERSLEIDMVNIILGN